MRAIHTKFIDRIGAWVHTHPRRAKLLIIVGTVIIVTIIVLLSLLLTSQRAGAPVATVTEPPKPVIYYSPLTGVKVKNKKVTQQPVTAIMIENSPDARPQSGLKGAGVVYEAIAEGGITRFLALYQETKPQLIGPVRSLRLYYVDWLAPFNPSVAHVGGSARALQIIRNGSYRDIDQFFNPGTYWRATDRWAPHNVYTSFKNIDALNKSKGYTSSKFAAWPRTDGEPATKPNAKKINVTISGPTFDSVYVYDKKINAYKRSQGGAPHTDREKGRITPRVVIALYTTENTVLEDGYRESIKTHGSGKAFIFQGGKVTKATWKKKDRKGQLQFVDAEGNAIKLFRGQTWITAVPTNHGGKVTWQQ
jgi:hypothetical protein